MICGAFDCPRENRSKVLLLGCCTLPVLMVYPYPSIANWEWVNFSTFNVQHIHSADFVENGFAYIFGERSMEKLVRSLIDRKEIYF